MPLLFTIISWSYCGQTDAGFVAAGPATEPVKTGVDEMAYVVAPILNGILFVLAIGATDERLVVYEDIGATSLGI